MNTELFDLAILDQSFETPRHRRHRPDIRRALRALRELLDDPEQTQKAFEIGYALDGDFFAACLPKMLASPVGRRVFREKPCLLDVLRDREALLTMPDGSFGRAYLDFIEGYQLDPGKLIELRRGTDALHAGRDEDLRWFIERCELLHDMWHVLTGYGADGWGEAALLAFTLAQRYTRGGTLLTLGASTRVVQEVGPSWLSYTWRAWRRGRNAVYLTALPYERLLPLPLHRVRHAVGIDDPAVAHPGGIVRGPQREPVPLN